MSDRAIIESIYKMVGLHKCDLVTYVNAEVVSVNIKKRVAVDGHTEYDLPDVKLMASVDDGFLIEPVIGSTVKVIFSQNIEPFICQYSEIENITIDAKTKVKFNDGSFGGLIKIKELTDKLNTLEKDLNTIKNVFATWTPIAETVLKTSLSVWSGQQITETKVKDIENPKITHGE
jgi:hypothetical protein